MLKKIIISVVVCLLVGGIGGFATAESIQTWYPSLNKPFFNPPNWIFGPVWTLLYTMMGVAFGLVWDRHPELVIAKKAMVIFGIQLLLNAVWSPAFFGLESPIMALPIIIALWIFIALTIKQFLPINKIAAYLLMPYLLWVSFATVLNAAIVYLN